MADVFEREAKISKQEVPGSPGEEGRIQEEWSSKRDHIPSTLRRAAPVICMSRDWRAPQPFYLKGQMGGLRGHSP